MHTRLHSARTTSAHTWHIVRVAASSVNLGSGYDTLAIALDRPFCFAYRQGRHDAVVAVAGRDKHLVPRDPKQHLFFHAANVFSRELNVVRPPIKPAAFSWAPIQADVGSSAAVQLCGIEAAAVLTGITLSRDEAFSLPARLEGHPDNAAVAVHGGLVVSRTVGGISHAHRLPVPPSVAFQLLVPTYRTASTAALRKSFPASVPRVNAICDLQCEAMLVAGFLSGDAEAISLGCQDRRHQPVCAPLMPGMVDVLELRPNAGIMGAVISGAGPSTPLMHAPSRPDAGERALSVFRRHDPRAQLMAVSVGDGYSCTYGQMEELNPLSVSFHSIHNSRQSSQRLPTC